MTRLLLILGVGLALLVAGCATTRTEGEPVRPPPLCTEPQPSPIDGGYGGTGRVPCEPRDMPGTLIP